MIDIDYSGAAGLDKISKQPELGFQISVEARMIIQMVARDIGEAGGFHPHAVEAMLIEAV